MGEQVKSQTVIVWDEYRVIPAFSCTHYPGQIHRTIEEAEKAVRYFDSSYTCRHKIAIRECIQEAYSDGSVDQELGDWYPL